MFWKRNVKNFGKYTEIIIKNVPEASEQVADAVSDQYAEHGSQVGDFETMKTGSVDRLHKNQLNGETLKRSMRYAIKQSKSLVKLLRRKEKVSDLFECMVEAMDDGIMVEDVKGIVVFTNKALAEMLGYKNKKEIYKRPWSDFFSMVDEKKTEGSKGCFESALVAREGNIIPILISSSSFYFKGEYMGVLSVIKDVTERNRAEKELEQYKDHLEEMFKRRTVELESTTRKLKEEIIERKQVKISEDEAREYAESIINTVREPLIALDQDLRVVKVSSSFYEFFKVKPEETMGQLIYDLGNKQWDIPRLRELLETILPQKATFDNYEVEHDFTTIGRRVMLLNARQIQRVLDKEQIILLAIEDITERRMADEQQRAYSAYTRSLIEASLDPLVTISAQGKITDVNEASAQATGVTREQLIGRDFSDYFTEPDKARAGYQKVFSEGLVRDYPLAIRHTSGRIIDVLYNAAVYKDDKGNVIGVFAAARDITDRREIQDGLEKANEELKELAVELKRAARAKSEFLANMSHELRTPLNSINGFSEVLYDETFGPLNEKQKRYVSNVLTSGKHLLILINQILDMAKVEAGKMNLSLSNIPLKSLLNEISMLVADMAGKKRIEQLLEIAEDLPDIEADDLKVKQILYNLLSNAVKFTPEGGNIGMKAKKSDSEIEIVVWDTGEGIAPENMEKIFEGFFRVDTPYSRVTEGTGLGLPLSKKLVELHGGKLVVESEGLNKGTLVRFTLPIESGKVV